jgi:hypothetical protein
MKYGSLRRGWLLSSANHQRLGCQAIELGKPLVDIREHRFDEHTSTGTTDSNAVAFESILARQSDGLTPAVSEQLGGGHGVVLTVYTNSLYPSGAHA